MTDQIHTTPHHPRKDPRHMHSTPFRPARAAVLSFTVLLLLLASLSALTACASRGGLSTPSAGLCSGVDAIQALCAAPGEKPRAIAQVCDQSGVIQLLCGPSLSSLAPVCPPPLPTGCISGVLASQKGRLMTENKRDLLAECAGYLAAVQRCEASEPAMAGK